MRPREARDIIMRMYKGDPTDAQKAALDVTYRILDLDLDPDQIRELKERDTAKAPTKDTDSGVRYTDDYICPNCGKHFIGTGIAEFCYHCGQRIRWED